MTPEQIKLSQVKVNKENPRTITTDKFQKLVNSILVFPKMLELRPVVVDKTFKALGGNMRTQALNFIAGLDLNAIQQRLTTIPDYAKLGNAERATLNTFWMGWIQNPTCTILRADSLTAAEREQFIIKDNVSYGAWDFDALANKFDQTKLGEWGMDVWQMPAVAPMTPASSSSPAAAYENPAQAEDDGSGVVNQFAGQLPPELEGRDLRPADLPDLQGSDEVAMERVIIVYPKDLICEMAALLGVEKVDKVVYKLEDLLKNGEE